MISIWRPNPSGGTAILMRTGYRFSVSRRACIDGRIILVLVRYLFAAYNLRSAVVELALYVPFRTTRTDAAVDDRIDPAIIDFARAGLAPPGAAIRLEPFLVASLRIFGSCAPIPPPSYCRNRL